MRPRRVRDPFRRFIIPWMRGQRNRGTTLFLRLVISLIALAAVGVCIFPLPLMIAKEAAKTADTAWQVYLFLAGACIRAAFLLFALYQAFKSLSHIIKDNAFSEPSVRALRHIKHAAPNIGLLMFP